LKIYSLHKTQFLPISLEEAWDFLSNPENLAVITPPYMGFKIASKEDSYMYPGQVIQYTVKPMLGIPLKWVTEITHVAEPHYFVDEQRFGPYAFWHHKHFLKSVDGGVEMRDIVHYKLPLGFLGTLIHPFLVKPKLEAIFSYRQSKLNELFAKSGML